MDNEMLDLVGALAALERGSLNTEEVICRLERLSVRMMTTADRIEQAMADSIESPAMKSMARGLREGAECLAALAVHLGRHGALLTDTGSLLLQSAEVVRRNKSD